MENPETLATLGTQDTGGRQKTQKNSQKNPTTTEITK